MADPIIPITRTVAPTPSAPAPAPVKAESKFPTEVISLPSKGWFYPPESRLALGTIELKMMTAKEEDILTSQNLIQKNIVLDKLLESLIIDKSINPEELFNCDRNAILFAVRRLAYGDKYDVNITCGKCSKESPHSIDLAKMDNRPFEFEKYPRGKNSFDFYLPYLKKTVTFKMLSKKDENAIEEELKGLQKVSTEITREVTTRLAHIITAVDGESDTSKVRRFVNNELVSRDSFALRKHIRETLPDIDSTFEFKCPHCGAERKEETPIGVNFFWPNG
jgi:hypothetical protein